MAANEQSPTPFEELDSDLAPEAPSALLGRSTAVDRDQNPDLETIRSVILKEGPRSRKQASHVIILDRNTGEFHHEAITIKTFKKRQGAWSEDADHSITLSSEGEDEI